MSASGTGENLAVSVPAEMGAGAGASVSAGLSDITMGLLTSSLGAGDKRTAAWFLEWMN